jgi:hypothetical protein
MKEIILDNTLEAVEEIRYREYSPRSFFDIKDDFTPITTINVLDDEVMHRNFLEYVVLCWKNHYGVVISPTILWNMVLANLAHAVNADPETYRDYFTESDEKIEIVVTQGGNEISTQLLINKLQELIPGDILNEFFPEFTTDTDKSDIADRTAFLDMVSPYYNYGMFLCGIPKFRILGSDEDWARFRVQCDVISVAIPEFEEYLTRVRVRSQDISQGYNFADFFSLQRCGSGSQVEVSGWIREFFIEQPSVNYPENFISCISKIDYKNYNEGGKEYRLYAGLFTSMKKNGYLIPSFENMYFEKVEECVENEPKGFLGEPEGNVINLRMETTQIKSGTLHIKDGTGSITVKEIDQSEIIK